MAIDLPPVEAVTAQPTPAWTTHAEQQGGYQYRGSDKRIRVYGAHDVARHRDLDEVLADCRDAKAVEEALVTHFRDIGLLNIQIATVTRGDLIVAYVRDEGLTAVEGPEPLRPYFDRFADGEPIAYSDFAKRRRLAELHARRAGFEPYATYRHGDGAETTMKIGVEEIRGSAWDWSAGLNNAGTRYFGRWTAHAGASRTSLDAFRIGLGVRHALPEFGDDASDARYDKVSAFVDQVTRWGVVRADASYARFEYNDTGSGRRGELPLTPADGPRYDGRRWQASLSAEHLLYESPNWRWSFREGVGTSRYRIDDVRTDAEPTDEEYSNLNAGLSARWSDGDHALQPVVFASTGIRKGLGLGLLTRDAQEDFLAVHSNGGVAGDIGDLGRLVVTVKGQHSTDPLPEQEEWVLGGSQRLSAWLPGVIVGDRGALGRAQFTAPVHGSGFGNLALHLAWEIGYAEFARENDAESTRRTLSNAEIGLTLTHHSQWQLSLVTARPTGEKNVDPDYLDRQRADFFLSLSRRWQAP